MGEVREHERGRGSLRKGGVARARASEPEPSPRRSFVLTVPPRPYPVRRAGSCTSSWLRAGRTEGSGGTSEGEPWTCAGCGASVAVRNERRRRTRDDGALGAVVRATRVHGCPGDDGRVRDVELDGEEPARGETAHCARTRASKQRLSSVGRSRRSAARLPRAPGRTRHAVVVHVVRSERVTQRKPAGRERREHEERGTHRRRRLEDVGKTRPRHLRAAPTEGRVGSAPDRHSRGTQTYPVCRLGSLCAQLAFPRAESAAGNDNPRSVGLRRGTLQPRPGAPGSSPRPSCPLQQLNTRRATSSGWAGRLAGAPRVIATSQLFSATRSPPRRRPGRRCGPLPGADAVDADARRVPDILHPSVSACVHSRALRALLGDD